MLGEVFLYVYTFDFKSCTSVKSNTKVLGSQKEKKPFKKAQNKNVYRNRNSKVQY